MKYKLSECNFKDLIVPVIKAIGKKNEILARIMAAYLSVCALNNVFIDKCSKRNLKLKCYKTMLGPQGSISLQIALIFFLFVIPTR